jgi:nitrate reductase NapAB chaperone NapD
MQALEKDMADGRKDASVKRIMSNLRTMNELITLSKEPFESLEFLSDYNRIREAMKDYTLRSFKTYVSSAIIALKTRNDEVTCKIYRDMHTTLKAQVDEIDESNVKTEKQEAKMVPYADLVKARDAMAIKVASFPCPCDKKQYQEVQAYMVLCISTMCDAVFRNQELCKMVIRRNWVKDPPTDRNYFLEYYNIMELYAYKTAGSYGKMVVVIQPELADILKDCLSRRPTSYKIEEDMPFLINQNGSALTEGGGIQRLYGLAGLDISPTIVRNIIATERSGAEIETIRKVQENAKNFGHSVSQHLKYCRTKSQE